ncbi:MAG: Uma2 family endonuclease [Xenococcaceae cyanobacterium]
MTVSTHQSPTEIFYADSDGEPMAESDPARDYLIYGVEALDLYFQERNDVYVSGNLFIYYRKGEPNVFIAPDVFVVFGASKKKRMSYKVWEEEGKVPSFVLEVTSKTTKKMDEEDKPQTYAKMGVLEYFQYDPTGDYLKPVQLKGSRLIQGKYQPITGDVLADGTFSLYSQTLKLDLCLRAGELRFYVPETNRKLLSYKETEEARQAEAQARRDAVPRLLELGLSVEQIAVALSLSAEEVRQLIR